MNWVRVKSKMLAAVAYNPEWHHLYLEFRSGDIYCYRAMFQPRDMRNFSRLILKVSIVGTTFCSTLRMIGSRERFAARADLYFSEK